MIKRLELNISGKVQGVSFRSEAQEQALQLDLKGYAKNNRDGSVTVVAVGEESSLKQLEQWCSQGPDSAHIENVHPVYSDPKPEETFLSFETY